jgi:hypothetical protein
MESLLEGSIPDPFIAALDTPFYVYAEIKVAVFRYKKLILCTLHVNLPDSLPVLIVSWC